MEEQNSLYELIKSRNDLTVPVIKGVHLHSKYNPQKEAEAFASGFTDALKIKNHILVFGLGFGYHVNAITEIVREFHQNYKIIVIEPNQRLVEDFEKEGGFNDECISISTEQDVQKLFESINFVNFLMQKPCIIKHDTSFNMQRDFYSKFLTYTSSKNIKDFEHLISNQEFLQYLAPYKDGCFEQLVKSIHKNGRINNKNDFLVLAMNELFVHKNIETTNRG